MVSISVRSVSSFPGARHGVSDIAKWTLGGGLVVVSSYPEVPNTAALAGINSDGTVEFYSKAQGSLVRKTAATGEVEIGFPPVLGWWSISTLKVSTDGRSLMFGLNQEAQQKWDEGIGWRTVSDYLVSRGSSSIESGLATVYRFSGFSKDHSTFGAAMTINGQVENVLVETLLNVPSELATNYCGPSNPNGLGISATLRAQGSVAISDNQLVLHAEYLPPGQAGYVINSLGQDFVALPAFGVEGFLCLGGGAQIGVSVHGAKSPF